MKTFKCNDRVSPGQTCCRRTGGFLVFMRWCHKTHPFKSLDRAGRDLPHPRKPAFGSHGGYSSRLREKMAPGGAVSMAPMRDTPAEPEKYKKQCPKPRSLRLFPKLLSALLGVGRVVG